MLNAWKTDPWYQQNALALLSAGQALTLLRAQEPQEQPELPERDPEHEYQRRISEQQGD